MKSSLYKKDIPDEMFLWQKITDLHGDSVGGQCINPGKNHNYRGVFKGLIKTNMKWWNVKKAKEEKQSIPGIRNIGKEKICG